MATLIVALKHKEREQERWEGGEETERETARRESERQLETASQGAGDRLVSHWGPLPFAPGNQRLHLFSLCPPFQEARDTCF